MEREGSNTKQVRFVYLVDLVCQVEPHYTTIFIHEKWYEDAFTFRPGAIGYHMAFTESVSIHSASQSVVQECAGP